MTSREHGVLPRGAGGTERRGYRWRSGGDWSSEGRGGLQVRMLRARVSAVVTSSLLWLRLEPERGLYEGASSVLNPDRLTDMEHRL
ncbi:unnamed protein product [Arctogadus glacialis]